jgi:hypothetical protein
VATVTAQRAQTRSAPSAAARLWIAHGVLWLLLIAGVWTAWVVSGDFTPNTLGRGDEPAWYIVTVRFVEVFFGIGVSGWILWRFVIAPKLRTGSVSFDGLFFLACWLMFFQEPWMNWFHIQFLYATTFLNFGSWLAQIPGWQLPNGELIPVPLVYGMAYLWMLGLGAYAGSRYMARQRRKDPGRSAARVVAQTFAWMVLIDLVVESLMVKLQLISYPRTVSELTLWAGTDHQFPLYESLSWPGTFILMSSLHFFRDDRGRSLPERGIDALRIGSGKLRTFARFAAIVGFGQLAILFTFNVPYWFWGTQADRVPSALLHREWRMAGVCGPNTDHDCGGPKEHQP